MIVSELKVGDVLPTGCRYTANGWNCDFFYLTAYDLTLDEWVLVEDYLLSHPQQAVEVGYRTYELRLSAKYQVQVDENAVQLELF